MATNMIITLRDRGHMLQCFETDEPSTKAAALYFERACKLSDVICAVWYDGEQHVRGTFLANQGARSNDHQPRRHLD